MLKFITDLPKDKIIHYTICFLIVFLAGGFFRIFLTKWWALLAGIIIASLCGIYREILGFTEPDKHSFEWKDLYADWAGIASAVVCAIIFIL